MPGATGTSSPKYPFIPHPEPTVEAIHATVLALKQAVDQLTGQVGVTKNNKG